MSEMAVDSMVELHRDEIDAIATYEQVIKAFDDGVAEELRRIQAEHRSAAHRLSSHFLEVESVRGCGSWGNFANAITGTTRVFGREVALKVLKEGEENGLRAYQHALDDPRLPVACKALLQRQLIPKARSHISSLQELLKQMSSTAKATPMPSRRSWRLVDLKRSLSRWGVTSASR